MWVGLSIPASASWGLAEPVEDAPSGSVRRLTVGTKAPEGDLRFVQHESMGLGGLEAGGGSHHAVDVGDSPAPSADHVVMIVAHPGFKERRTPRRFDPASQSRVGEGAEGVVHGLLGNLSQARPDSFGNPLDGQVPRLFAEHVEGRDALRRGSEARPFQGGLKITWGLFHG
jgi:hypothetical protein